MSLRRLLTLAWKETLHVLRDPRSLAVALAIPVFMLLLFGWALSTDVRDVSLVVLDAEMTPASRQIVSALGGSRTFDTAAWVESPEAAGDMLRDGSAKVVLLLGGTARGAPAMLLLDGTDAYTASVASSHAAAILGRLSGGSQLHILSRALFNESLASRNAIIPGLIAVILMVISALLTSLTIAREWETGTMEMLAASPLRPWEIIIGKLLPYFGIGLIDLAMASLTGVLLFGVPFRGSPALLLFLSSVFMAGSLSMGIAISTLTRNQLLASQLAMITTFLPAFLLSGLLFNLDNLPPVVQAVSRIVPARYFVRILKAIYLEGAGLEFLAAETAFLLIFAVVVLAATRTRFRLRIGGGSQ